MSAAPFDLIAALNAPFEAAIARLPKPTNPQPSLLPYLTPEEALVLACKALEQVQLLSAQGRYADLQNVAELALERCAETLQDIAEDSL